MSASNSNFKWWQTAVVYQIYPRSFKDSSGDGIGDLQGIIDKLDYLNDGTPDSTGIDAIWISPIYPSPMADFGYDVSDYKNIHPMFGDLETFDRLIAEAHQRGIRIILDYVPNHTSDEHPWFIESRSSRDNAKSDWYIWRDAKPDGSPPNNWTSMFGGRGWTWDENRKQYYLHLFLDKQPDLNWRNPDVQEAMLEVLRFWLDRGVDGFRMDVISYLMKNPDLPDNPLLPEIDTRHLPANDLWYRQKHEHDIDQPEIHDILRRIRHLFDEYEDRVTIGEVIGTDSRERWAKYYGQNLDELHLPFNFDLMHKPWNAAVMRASVEKLESVLPPGATPNYVLGNHDVSRFASRFGEQAVRTAGMLLLTLRGVPTIYMGEELGMVDGKILPEQMQDPQGFNLGVEKTRDVCRTPFQWSDAPFAGFSEVEPWLPIAEGYQTCNVEHQRHDPRSVFSLYRKFIHLRK
ncbi:MAG TPA: alpha-amylase family glycosyl hydrolase, partial [Aggregatilineales bacterium]|nr:alpha-amylase family glycosyl hydrolase [Aggregatilineales bacterium]